VAELVALRVDDASSASYLGGRGVTPKAETVDSGACLMARVGGPSGNALTLQQRYASRGLAGAGVASVSATLVFSAAVPGGLAADRVSTLVRGPFELGGCRH
jgi:hypothetical protein